jgi:hypothetical protein
MFYKNKKTYYKTKSIRNIVWKRLGVFDCFKYNFVWKKKLLKTIFIKVFPLGKGL